MSPLLKAEQGAGANGQIYPVSDVPNFPLFSPGNFCGVAALAIAQLERWAKMKFHDYYLRGYSVADHGETITLDLVDSLKLVTDVSVIRFSEVIVYHFTHLGGTIITDIFETTFQDAATEMNFDISKMQKMLGGLPFDANDNSEFQRYFNENNFKTWLLTSAIGFLGLIVAKNAQQGAGANG